MEAMVSAMKVRFTAWFAEKSVAPAAPARTPWEHTAQEMGVVSEDA
jgi:hypothetical protein